MFSFGRPRIVRALAAVSVLPVVVALAAGCSNSGAGTTADGKAILRYQGQTGTVSPVELATDLGYFSEIELKWVGDTTSGPANIQAATTKQIDRELQIWIDWLVRNGELPAGKLAATDLFTNEFNPYANGKYQPGSGPTGEAVAAK